MGDLDTNYYLFKYLILLFQLLNHVFSVLVDGQLWWWWWLHARWWKFCFAHGRVPREEGLLSNNCYIIVVGNSSLNHVFQRYKIPLLDGKQTKAFISIIIPCLLVFLSGTIRSFQISSQWLC